MAIDTYLALKTAVADYLHRTDLTSVIPTFVALAESSIATDLRIREMEATMTGTLAASTLALPTRFLEARYVSIGGDLQQYVPPAAWYGRSSWSNGDYTIIGTDFHFQSSSADYEIAYYAMFAPLSGDTDTNALLAAHPNVYLFGALTNAAIYLEADPTRWAAMYERACARIRTSQNKFTGPLTVRPDVMVV